MGRTKRSKGEEQTRGLQRAAAAALKAPVERAVELGGGVTLDLMLIPAGEFLMGSSDSEEDRYGDEGPQHRVKITIPFYMGKYEVTQEQWQAVVGDNPSHFRGARNPVEQVSWYDCQQFLRGAGGGLRLPTEAEWEYACRAGTTTPFHSGETISTGQANYDGSYTYGSGRKGEYRQETVPVGSFRPNAWGLHDMHGNVWEWCQSLYSDYPYRADDGREDLRSSGERVLRGGSWIDTPRGCRSADRYRIVPAVRDSVAGFRVVAEF